MRNPLPKNSKKSTNGRVVDTILSINIDSSPKPQLLNRIEGYFKNKKKFLVVTPNPEIILYSQSDILLQTTLNSAEISIPDGTGLLFAAKILGKQLKHRIQGRIFMLDICALLNKKPSKVYLLGSTDAVIQDSITILQSRYPNLSVQGNAGFKLGHDGKTVAVSEKKKELQIIDEINNQKPDMLFLAFGAPKQEKWFALHKDELSVIGAMVVGGSLDVLSGHKKVPPVVFQKSGVEWIWRLVQEPQRIGRIVNAVILFPLLVFKEKMVSSLR